MLFSYYLQMNVYCANNYWMCSFPHIIILKWSHIVQCILLKHGPRSMLKDLGWCSLEGLVTLYLTCFFSLTRVQAPGHPTQSSCVDEVTVEGLHFHKVQPMCRSEQWVSSEEVVLLVELCFFFLIMKLHSAYGAYLKIDFDQCCSLRPDLSKTWNSHIWASVTHCRKSQVQHIISLQWHSTGQVQTILSSTPVVL